MLNPSSSSLSDTASKEKVNPAAPDLSLSFFVGDAAGRKGDFSDSDKKFAEAVGVRFFNETEFFGQSRETCSSAKLDDLHMQIFGCTQIVVVLVGAPGSGKSHFCGAVLEVSAAGDGDASERWSVVSQDVLKVESDASHLVGSCSVLASVSSLTGPILTSSSEACGFLWPMAWACPASPSGWADKISSDLLGMCCQDQQVRMEHNWMHPRARKMWNTLCPDFCRGTSRHRLLKVST